MQELEAERRWHGYVERNVDARVAQLRARDPHATHAGADRYARRVLAELLADDGELEALVGEDERYFGRIDHVEGHALYLGRTRVRDLLDERPASHAHVVDDVVTNWQAPAAAAFYRARPGAAHDVHRRRRFRFVDGQLVGYSDEELLPRRVVPSPPADVPAGAPGPGADGVEPVPEPAAGPVTATSAGEAGPGAEPEKPAGAAEPIGGGIDVLLDELGRERDAYMRDIVATIQAEQYELMESDNRTLLTVQGAPGTGKTAVALHRLSLLAFREPALRSSGLVLVGPSERFLEYVSRVLPALGDDQVRHTTVTELTTRTAAWTEQDRRVQRLKGDPRLAELLRRAVDRSLVVPDHPLEVTLDATVLTFSRADALAALRAVLADPAPHRSRHGLLVSRLVATLGQRFVAGLEGGSLRRSGVRDPYGELQRDRALQAYAEEMCPPVGPDDLLARLWSSSTLLLDVGRGLLDDDETSLLWRSWDARPRPEAPRSRRSAQQHRWSDADLPLLDELDVLVDGASQRVGHVAVDEAQDLTPMQLRSIGRRVPATGGVTLLGDLAQTTGPWMHRSWAELVEHLGHPATHVEAHLTQGYRLPGAVLALANAVLPHTGAEVAAARAVRDLPDSLTDIPVAPGADVLRTGADLAVALAGSALTALLAPARLLDRLGDEERARCLAAGVVLTTAEDAKGLEFDHVVLLEPAAFLDATEDADGSPDEAAAARALYVATTRATRSLALVHRRPLPFGLGDVVAAATRAAATQPVPAPPTPVHAPAIEAPTSHAVEAVGSLVLVERPVPAPGERWPYEHGGRAYKLSARHADVQDPTRKVWLSSVIGAAAARAIATALLQHRPEGGRIRVHDDGHVTTRAGMSSPMVYLGQVDPQLWFGPSELRASHVLAYSD
ncbi:AAA family ATPase [Cellulomonas marina]|uniref:DNA helicase IV n=1 Tax=Cellulomonas marina TaxID=988821 RepID=A0A1I1AK11_9CELL|nr:AAA family ATPase [Cellulomonas marina]GIG30219.1 hypothetical protein Cma02nite_28190 [Cellulomonas marina]SFB36838.1 DNA helicase IV [Cellulomonas marina]